MRQTASSPPQHSQRSQHSSARVLRIEPLERRAMLAGDLTDFWEIHRPFPIDELFDSESPDIAALESRLSEFRAEHSDAILGELGFSSVDALDAAMHDEWRDAAPGHIADWKANALGRNVTLVSFASSTVDAERLTVWELNTAWEFDLGKWPGLNSPVLLPVLSQRFETATPLQYRLQDSIVQRLSQSESMAVWRDSWIAAGSSQSTHQWVLGRPHEATLAPSLDAHFNRALMAAQGFPPQDAEALRLGDEISRSSGSVESSSIGTPPSVAVTDQAHQSLWKTTSPSGALDHWNRVHQNPLAGVSESPDPSETIELRAEGFGRQKILGEPSSHQTEIPAWEIHPGTLGRLQAIASPDHTDHPNENHAGWWHDSADVVSTDSEGGFVQLAMAALPIRFADDPIATIDIELDPAMGRHRSFQIAVASGHDFPMADRDTAGLIAAITDQLPMVEANVTASTPWIRPLAYSGVLIVGGVMLTAELQSRRGMISASDRTRSRVRQR